MDSFARPGVIPLLRTSDRDTAFLAASVLLQEKIPVLAVAFTGEETAQTLARLASSFPELILGAEGVTSEAACRAACSSPLRFVAMPYFDEIGRAHV